MRRFGELSRRISVTSLEKAGRVRKFGAPTIRKKGPPLSRGRALSTGHFHFIDSGSGSPVTPDAASFTYAVNLANFLDCT